MRSFLVAALEILEIAVVAIGAVFLIRYFLIQPFLVSGESMVPNFYNGDYLLIDELSYRLRSPQRGEVIVFRYPGNESVFFIKRIIGLPNERLAIGDNRVKIFNSQHPQGFILAEKYLPAGSITGGRAELQLKGDQFLVLGDNRASSFDSRNWGLLSREEIIGLVRLRLWPLNDLRAFAAPQY